MRDFVSIHYPEAKRIRVVLDNLSTHSPGALYETFPAADAHRILDRIEFHHTPKHARQHAIRGSKSSPATVPVCWQALAPVYQPELAFRRVGSRELAYERTVITHAVQSRWFGPDTEFRLGRC